MKTHVALSAIALAIALAIVLVNGQKIDTPIPCRQTLDCRNITTLPRNAFCKDGYCMCPNEAKNCSSLNTSVHQLRVPGPLVHRKCKLEQDCVFQGGYCNQVIKQCDCLRDYVPSSNRQYCVPALNSINAKCIDKNQCLSLLANSTCYQQKCICQSDYYYKNNTCWRKVEYGHRCTKNQECSYIDNAICTDDGMCECMAETVLNTNGTKCLFAAKKIMDECVETVQCATTFNRSTCTDNLCQCEPDHHYENEMTRCFPSKALDEDCANDYECYQIDTNDTSTKSLKCKSNKCTCADNYIRSNNTCVSSGLSLAVSLSVILFAVALVLFS